MAKKMKMDEEDEETKKHEASESESVEKNEDQIEEDLVGQTPDGEEVEVESKLNPKKSKKALRDAFRERLK